MNIGLQIVFDNAKKDPNYCPYCMRCSGLVRMVKVSPFYWRCERRLCGAVHDMRKEARENGEVA